MWRWNINSWDYEQCSWCREIRQKYHLRFKIAEKLGLNEEVIQKFDELKDYALCPLHKELTVHPAYAKSLRKFKVTCEEHYELAEEPAIVFEWWSNKNDYKAVLLTGSKCIDFYKNGNFVATLTNHNLIAELLTLLSRDELEMIENFLKEEEEKEEVKEFC